MDLEITIHGNEVSFNVDCLYGEDNLLRANDRISINVTSLTINEVVSIPESIGIFTNLVELTLDDNQLTSLPKSIGNLTKLEYLIINNNRLRRLPESIGNLSNLKVLILDDNHLTTLPASIEGLQNLEELNLQYNRITRIPGSIGRLRNLQRLDLKDNQIVRLPEEIGNLRRLRFIDLENNPLLYLPATIARLPNLSIDLNSRVILEPLQEQYIFQNPNLLYTIKQVFNIRKYNRLMKLTQENKTSIKKYAKASTRHYSKKISTRKKYVDHINSFVPNSMQLKENPPSSKVFAKDAFVKHINSFSENYVDKTINEVLVRA